MKRKIVIACVVAVVLGLLALGIGTDVLPEKILPALGKAVKAIPPKMWVSFLFKILVLTGLMGYVTKLVNARKERFFNGEVPYNFNKDYSLVVGYDSQARPLIKRLLTGAKGKKVLLVTNRDVRAIRAEMATELTSKEEAKRLFYMRRDLALAETYAGLGIRGADSIYLLGDAGVAGRDGIVLRASEMIAAKAKTELVVDTARPVKAFLQLEDPGVFAQMRSQELSMDKKDDAGRAMFDLEVFNYYDSWVWKCWSEKRSGDGDSPYLPIRFKPDAERVELFVIGSGKAAKAVVDSAIILMNYGKDEKANRLILISDRAFEILPPADAIAALPELEVVDYPMRELTRQGYAQMCAAAAEEKTAMTVVIVDDAPEKVVKTYLGLPFALRSRDVSALLWMGSQSRNLLDKALIKVAGDRTELRYFGMTDCQPWFGGVRQQEGISVNFYYNECYGDKRLPKGTDTALVPVAKTLWNEEKAIARWNGTSRWEKWSSICSADSFKEKSAVIHGRELTSDIQLTLLKAEHNRWWAERLLGDWRLGANEKGKKNEARRLHPDLVPFEKLSDFTKDIDKLGIAAMARQGYFG